MRRALRIRLAAPLLVAALFSATVFTAQPPRLGPAERIADGVLLYRLDDPGLLDPAGPVAVQALRLDPAKVTLRIGVANDRLPGRETVQQMAARHGAMGAMNAGFFSLTDGRPAAFLKTRGTVVHGTRRPRGAVGVIDRLGTARLFFDRVAVTTLRGTTAYRPRLGTSARDWSRAANGVSGAGLLVLNGTALTDWADERLKAGFNTTRHPRTLIGVDADGAIWLVTVDGRQPALSLGMTFTELQGLSQRLGLQSALNLDGGGSTTMVVRGSIVNHPSDPAGPRPVTDAWLVFPRKP